MITLSSNTIIYIRKSESSQSSRGVHPAKARLSSNLFCHPGRRLIQARRLQKNSDAKKDRLNLAASISTMKSSGLELHR